MKWHLATYVPRVLRFVLWLLAGILFAIATPLEVIGEDGRPSVLAQRLNESEEEGIHLDGWLKELAWQSGPIATGLRQQEPSEGAPATEETEVRVIYDSQALYIGVLARDREPEDIIARILQRDRVMETDFGGRPRFAGDDAVAILLDPFHDHRNAVIFATNPNGAAFEALITDEGREFNIDWRGVWEVAAQRTADGWSAEFAIPLRTLRYPSNPGTEPWGFNIYRVIRRKNEEVLWSAWSRKNEGFARVSRAGHLEGLTDLPRGGVNLELKPFALSGATRERIDPIGIETDPRLDFGLDAKYEVQPGLVLDATVNTDFAQVEVDDEQVNLTRFELFFPEKRDFFLENAGVFEFGVRGLFEPPPFLLFFSRRIGLVDDGEVPVLGGVRLTGRVGRQTVGFLDVLTEHAFGDPRTNFGVLRVKRDVGSSNFIGAMLTDRRQRDSSNTAGGIDWSFWPTGTLNLQGFIARTQATGTGGDDYAYRLGANYQTSLFGFRGQHLFIGPEATAEMGFITRTDIRRTGGFARLTSRPRVLGLRSMNFFWNSEYITRTDGELQDWMFGPAMSPDWESGESFVVYFLRGFSRLDEEFELTDDVVVPVGDYHMWQLGWFGNSSRNRPVVFTAEASIQEFFDGHLFSFGGTAGLAIDKHLGLTVGYTHNSVEVPWGEFDADLASARISYAFSTQLIANALLQYNSLDKFVSANIRVNFIHRPGSDVFIVLNEERGSETSTWDFANRGLVVKVTYLARI